MSESPTGGTIDQISELFGQLPSWGKVAVAGTAAVVAYVPYRYWTSRPRPSPFKSDWQQGIVYLYQYPRSKQYPNASPYCLKLETWLRIADIAYEVPEAPISIRSKEGTLPFVELDGVEYHDSNFAIERLTRELNKEHLEEHLSDETKAVTRAFEIMAEKSLIFSEFASRVDHIDKIIDSMDPTALGYVGLILKSSIVRGFTTALSRRVATSDFGRHTKEERIAIGLDDIRAFSKYLGNKHYFTGFKPTKIDATIFGVLATIVYAPYESAHLDVLKSECPNLLEFVERVKTRYWPDWNEITSTFARNSNWKRKPKSLSNKSSPTSSLASPLGRK